MESKLLTVAIPMYNVENYICECLESLADLSKYTDIEVLVVDDGSTDKSFLRAKDYVEKYPSLYRIHRKENGGYGSVLNYAIAHAQGKYFKVLDSDDWFDPRALQDLVDSLRQEDSDIVFTPFVMHEIQTGKKIRFDKPPELLCGKHYVFEEVCDYCFVAMHNMTIKTEVLRDGAVKIDENTFYTDLEFVIYPLRYVNDITFYDYPVYQYRIGVEGQSVSHEGWYKHRDDHALVIERLIEELNRYSAESRIGKYIKRKLFETITVHFRMYSQFDFRKHDLRAELKEFDEAISPVKLEWRKECKDPWVTILVATNFMAMKPLQIMYRIKTAMKRSTL